MPEAMERKLRAKASKMQPHQFKNFPGMAAWRRWSSQKRREWLKKARDAFVYGTLRKTGWTPSR